MVLKSKVGHPVPKKILVIQKDMIKKDDYSVNSTCKKIPLGTLSDEEYQQLEARGRVVRIQTLQPWGKAVTVFARKPEEVWFGERSQEESMLRNSPIRNCCGSEGPATR